MAMLVHGTRTVSPSVGNGGFGAGFPANKVEGAKFYTQEKLAAMAGEKPASTWPGKKEASSEEEEQSQSILGVVAKLVTAPNDVNKTESQANQDAITVVQDGANITVKGNLASLNSFASTNPNQGTAKWIALDIETKAESITSVTWNGSALTADDVAESASVGLAQNHIIFWAKAEALPRTINIASEGFESVALVVSFEEA